MTSFDNLTDDDIEDRIKRLREIIAQNEMIKLALNALLLERSRRRRA